MHIHTHAEEVMNIVSSNSVHTCALQLNSLWQPKSAEFMQHTYCEGYECSNVSFKPLPCPKALVCVW